ncbi:glycosyltransferase [soil metagenome]
MALRWIALGCAALPAALFLRNLRLFKTPRATDEHASVSILIPARDEEANIGAALNTALANPDAEVVLLDDGSTDRTREIADEIARREPRLRILEGAPLPSGWIGKNHACAQLAKAASRPLLLFVDADVRLAPDAATRLAVAMRHSRARLISGVPRQEVGTFSEKLLVPLIQFLLLGFLPFDGMRRSRRPAFGTACGQLIMVDREAYERCGGHRAIRGRVHEGLALPKQFRAAGFHTDLVDATKLATCRMYRRNADVWSGFAKNTHEGLGAPARIVPITLLLLSGQVLPFALLPTRSWQAIVAAGLASLPRVVAARRFHQPLVSVVLHPIAIVAILAVQWAGLARWITGRPANWKGRELTADRVPLADAGEQIRERVQHAIH